MSTKADLHRAEGARDALRALADDLEAEARIEAEKSRGGLAKYLAEDLVPRIRREADKAELRARDGG